MWDMYKIETPHTGCGRYLYRAFVRRVYDGDSLRADIDLGFGLWMPNSRLRLARVDCPELKGKDRPAGLIAKDFTRDLLPVSFPFWIESISKRTDKHGRMIVEAWIHEGGSVWSNVSNALLEAKLAVKYELREN